MASTDIEYKDGQPQKGSRMQGFMKSIYDSENKTFIGRTGSSWAKIGVFYLIYYSCLTGFFAISLIIFFKTMSDDRPTQIGYNSLIKSNPGMSFRPMPNIESTLIKFHQGQPESYQKYKANIETFLAKYANNHPNLQDCAGERPAEGKACKFDVTSILGSACSEGNDYGYFEGKPCILLKINRVYGWEPEVYDNETMPEDLAGYDVSPKGVFVTCEGENAGDIDNLGAVEVIPQEGFLNNFFPYLNVAGYQGPIVFVKLSNLKGGVITQVWCKAWAKNIKHHKNDKAGSTHFEILMD
jgi:sodium/potassium-transporting ATPase subunit beta